jgi:phytoene/squalene synthetase
MTAIAPRAADHSKTEPRSAALARSITWSGSKHSFLIAGLLVDPHLRDDCYRAYGYFRWADDEVDDSDKSTEERVSFVHRQQALVQSFYERQTIEGLTPEEQIIADLIQHDYGADSGLRSFIVKFLEILEFDAHRKGNRVTQQQLTWYSSHLGHAVTDGIQHFVGNGHQYPQADNRHLAATGAHITHMLRDMVKDIPEGFINIPVEYLGTKSIGAEELESATFRVWVRQQVELARDHFLRGKQYIDGIDLLRCKLVAYWYCTRFECVLDAIEHDNFVLRADYCVRRSPSTLLKMLRDGLSVTFKHLFLRPSQVHQKTASSQER